MYFPWKVLDLKKGDCQSYVNYFMKERREEFFSAHKTCMTMISKLELKKTPKNHRHVPVSINTKTL